MYSYSIHLPILMSDPTFIRHEDGNSATEIETLQVTVVVVVEVVGSHSPWRIATLLPAALQSSHQNGGWVFLIFVADPITVRLCRTCSISYRPRRPLEPETANYDRYNYSAVL